MRRVPSLWCCRWLVVLAILAELAGSASCMAAVTREEVERAIREGVRFLKSAAACRRLLGRRRKRREDRYHQPGHAGPADRRREARLARDPQGALSTSAASAPMISTARMRSRCKPWSSPPPSRSATSCGSPPMSPGWSVPRSSRAIRVSGRARGPTPTRSTPGPATIRTPSTHCSACTPPARWAFP